MIIMELDIKSKIINSIIGNVHVNSFLFLLRGIFGVYHYFYFWWENLMSHMTYDVEGTQDAILDPL